MFSGFALSVTAMLLLRRPGHRKCNRVEMVCMVTMLPPPDTPSPWSPSHAFVVWWWSETEVVQGR